MKLIINNYLFHIYNLKKKMSTESNQTNTQRLIKFKTLDNNITEMNVDADVKRIK